MRKPRKNYTPPPEKVAILRRHLIERVPVSDLCDEYQLQPTLFYAWQKIFFENGATAFDRKNSPAEPCGRRRRARSIACACAAMWWPPRDGGRPRPLHSWIVLLYWKSPVAGPKSLIL